MESPVHTKKITNTSTKTVPCFFATLMVCLNLFSDFIPLLNTSFLKQMKCQIYDIGGQERLNCIISFICSVG